MIRGYFEGALWALIIGGLAVGTWSYHDDPTIRPAGTLPAPADAAAPVTTQPVEETTAVVDDTAPLEVSPPAAQESAQARVVDDTPPTVMATVAQALPAAPAPTDLPPLPRSIAAPVIDQVVPVLTNVAGRPERPALDPAPFPAPQAEAPGAVAGTVPPDRASPPAQATAPDTAPSVALDTTRSEAPAAGRAPAMPAPATAEITFAQAVPDGSGAGVVINRPETSPTVSPGAQAAVIAPPDATEDAPALKRFAAAFDNPDGLPVLAVLLVDDGTRDAPVAAVARLGFAPTVVVNALAPDAADRLAAYRDAGAEVAMELALPEGALPSDVEVAFEAAIGLMPQVTMLYSSGNDVVQGDRQVTTQIMQVLAERGMGFVAQERGLGGAIRAATQAQVPAIAVARDLDDGGATGAMMRALDQSAFRARQTGDAVLRAGLDTETLTTLAAWAAENGDAGTIMGPVSSVMRDAD